MPTDEPPRRGFLKTATVLIGGAIGAVLAVPIIRYVGFPVGKRTVVGGDVPVPVADEAAVKPGAPPLRVQVRAPEQRDAWSKVIDVPLGAAWLLRTQDGQVKALSATCPHLGCAVDYDPAAKQFRCPCHTSAFSPDGKRISGPAKRDMDSLECSLDAGKVLVKFEHFKQDVAEKEKA
jgi:menaquinol-cytochrome c reductase iron-sulfur subunit